MAEAPTFTDPSQEVQDLEWVQMKVRKRSISYKRQASLNVGIALCAERQVLNPKSSPIFPSFQKSLWERGEYELEAKV